MFNYVDKKEHTYTNLYRVFAAVIVTSQEVTYALFHAPDASQAYKSGRKLLSLILNSGQDTDQGEKRPVSKVMRCRM